MPEIEFDPVDTIAAGAVGAPGHRSFYVQAAKGGQVVSVLVEKQQVALLADRLRTLLDQIEKQFPGIEVATAGSDIGGDPVPLFRAVAIGIGFDPGRQMIVLELHERPVLDEGAEEPDDDPGDAILAEAIAAVIGDDPLAGDALADDPGAGEPGDESADEPGDGYLARLFLTAGQARALALGGTASVEAGRPPCQLCGNPLDPGGHVCPKMNGHGRH
jgi:uncharacterized repeat protein (TIGR03847 family)